jgi:hypothetical protein
MGGGLHRLPLILDRYLSRNGYEHWHLEITVRSLSWTPTKFQTELLKRKRHL